MDKEKVLNLAKLSRIELSDEEAESLSHEFDAILNYVGEVKKVSVKSGEVSKKDFALKNILREDTAPHETGLYKEKLLSQAPAREGDYIKVKKIL